MNDLTVLYLETEMGLKCLSERYSGIEGFLLVLCVCVCVSRPGGHTDLSSLHFAMSK